MTSLPALVNPGAKLGNRTFSKSGIILYWKIKKKTNLFFSFIYKKGQIANQDNGWTMAPNERNSLKTVLFRIDLNHFKFKFLQYFFFLSCFQF